MLTAARRRKRPFRSLRGVDEAFLRVECSGATGATLLLTTGLSGEAPFGLYERSSENLANVE
jgi:hypothetical protein